MTSDKKNHLIERLNSIEEKLRSPTLLKGEGLGNEIRFFIFDYPPEFEIEVRDHVQRLASHLKNDPAVPRILLINLFHLAVDYLKSRELFDRVVELEKQEGSQEVFSVLQDLLTPENLCGHLLNKYNLKEYGVLFVVGVGTCWPFLRAHTILNNLQDYIGELPVVLFYPGKYTGTDFYPFGLQTLKANYYRAFPLVRSTYER